MLNKSLNAVWAAPKRNSSEVRETATFFPSFCICRVLPGGGERNIDVSLLNVWYAKYRGFLAEE